MDRALKERIIGAAVLVVFVVLVVPVFLDGPPEEGEIISKHVPLPGQEENAGESRTVVLERDRAEPVPAAAVVAEPEPERETQETGQPVQTAARQEPESEPESQSASQTDSCCSG